MRWASGVRACVTTPGTFAAGSRQLPGKWFPDVALGLDGVRSPLYLYQGHLWFEHAYQFSVSGSALSHAASKTARSTSARPRTGS